MNALADLLAVQDVDLAMDRLRHQRVHLPERGELSSTLSEEEVVRGALSELEGRRSQLQERQKRAEAELAATEQRAAAIDKRLYGGQVAAARDLQAMSAELSQLKARASDLEDGVLELLEVREPLDAQSSGLEQRAVELADRGRELRALLATAEAAIDQELAVLEQKRVEAAAAVPEGLLGTYDRLRSRLGGIGVARLVGNRCDGCHLTLSSAELEQVRHQPEGTVYQCEQCSRILVP